ncbi:type 4a pilus biogenesis protein PilO [Vibrio sinaloensis]|uniref:type 4a pilus biogenesis protein PilO n=1 Tax=Photobacterium sp. (strain ATCC 43367) TaxID=379097 RepID=UPI0022AE88D3|nr:type 4a pilus biogenesis protein PilO [Vibrio sinaloensis]MCZ4296125.1 type 4a pilus biogenesis protein PilO [Vibrio sinaloensis]
MAKLAFNIEQWSQWPLRYQLLITLLLFVFIQGIGYQWYLSQKLAQAVATEKQQKQLQLLIDESLVKLAELTDIKANYRLALEQKRQISEPFLSQPDITDVVVEMNQLGVERNLTFTRIEVQEQDTDRLFNRQLINIELSGRYFDIGAFIRDLAQFPQVIVVEEVYWQSSGEANSPLKLRLRVYLYQLLIGENNED